MLRDVAGTAGFLCTYSLVLCMLFLQVTVISIGKDGCVPVLTRLPLFCASLVAPGMLIKHSLCWWHDTESPHAVPYVHVTGSSLDLSGVMQAPCPSVFLGSLGPCLLSSRVRSWASGGSGAEWWKLRLTTVLFKAVTPCYCVCVCVPAEPHRPWARGVWVSPQHTPHALARQVGPFCKPSGDVWLPAFTQHEKHRNHLQHWQQPGSIHGSTVQFSARIRKSASQGEKEKARWLTLRLSVRSGAIFGLPFHTAPGGQNGAPWSSEAPPARSAACSAASSPEVPKRLSSSAAQLLYVLHGETKKGRITA